MSAHDTKCDPNMPTGSGSGQWKPTKEWKEGYRLADTVKAKLMRTGGSLSPASREEAIQEIMLCTADDKPSSTKYGLCEENKYDIVVDAKGVITELTQLFDV
ncbi:hypothetical protein AB0D04_14455 [Streptomyces sp. NPDC048483]|uniref:hypothetical protein n=1 Tax=Streptomyces sp. NPDC048483 TaxID=3154927 RepID=UPI00342CAB81